MASLFSTACFANDGYVPLNLNLTDTAIGLAALTLFLVAYIFVMTEEFTHLRKSKPVVVVAGIIWILIGFYASHHDISDQVKMAVQHHILEFSELFMFLLVAIDICKCHGRTFGF